MSDAGHPFLIIGHRGAAGLAPENTLASVRKALALGARAIEIDVQFVDGRLVVFHDDTLERRTDGSGLLRDKTFAELRALDAGGGERIPTLDEVLDALGDDAAIHVELKGPDTAAPVAAAIAARRGRDWPVERFLVSSFDWEELRGFRRLARDVPVAVLVSVPRPDLWAVAGDLHAVAVNPALGMVDEDFVRTAHARRLKIYVFTVNRPDDLERMRRLGVDGVFTDYPGSRM